MKEERIQEILNSTPNFMSVSDLQNLAEYASGVKNGVIVEIGAYGGASATTLAESSPTSTIVVIDPYSDQAGVYKDFIKMTKNIKNIRLIRDYSQNVGKEWNKEIDFLHIDGDHSYKTVLSDIKMFVPHVKKGSYIFFHDYQAPRFGVSAAVNKFVGKYYKIIKVFGYAICQKI
jgi:predicted O-methyltransferase YrrM